MRLDVGDDLDDRARLTALAVVSAFAASASVAASTSTAAKTTLVWMIDPSGRRSARCVRCGGSQPRSLDGRRDPEPICSGSAAGYTDRVLHLPRPSRVTVLAALATVVALASALNTGPHMWRLLDREGRTYAAYTDTERRHATVEGLGMPPDIFDFYRQYVTKGDRIYYQVRESGFSSYYDLPTAIRLVGHYYLLPAVEAPSLRDATVVVTFFDDPKLLHVPVPDPAGGGPAADLRLTDQGAVTGRILALALANVVLLVLGIGLLPLLRLADTRRQLLTRLPLAYAVGVAAGGILTAHLALLHVPVGRIGLPLLAAASLVLGLRRVRPSPPRTGRRWRLEDVAAVAVLGVAAAFAVSGGAAPRSEAPVRLGRLDDLGDTRPGALRFRASDRAGVHRSELPGAAASALPAGPGGARRAFHGSLGRDARAVATARPGSRLRGRRVGAAPGAHAADPAGGDAAGRRHRAAVLPPAADELRGHPARHVARARSRGAACVAADRSGRMRSPFSSASVARTSWTAK